MMVRFFITIEIHIQMKPRSEATYKYKINKQPQNQRFISKIVKKIKIKTSECFIVNLQVVCYNVTSGYAVVV